MAETTKANQTGKGPSDTPTLLQDVDIAKAVNDVTQQALKIPIGIIEAVGEGLSGMFDSARRNSTASK
jgi:hypothetical protein